MQIINQNAHTNNEGIINISIPTLLVDTDVELVVVISPAIKAGENNQLTNEEIQLIEERWEEYQKNPNTAKSWEEVKTTINKKYGI